MILTIILFIVFVMSLSFIQRKGDLIHKCKLYKNGDDIVSRRIDSGWMISFRRKFKKFTMANKSNPEAKCYLKSTMSIRSEQHRHIHHYYYSIHPYSLFHLSWHILMFFVYTIIFFLVPIEITYLKHTCNMALQKFAFDAPFIIDMILSFFMGFYNPTTSRIVLRRKKIVIQYLKTFFIFDFMACLPTFLFFMCFHSPHLMNYVKFCNCFKIFRYRTWQRGLKSLRNVMGCSVYVYKAMGVLLSLLMSFFWAGAIVNLEDKSNRHKGLESQDSYKGFEGYDKLYSFFKGLVLLLTVGFEQKPTKVLSNLIFEIVFLSIGFILQLSLHLQILQIWNIHDRMHDREISINQQFVEYTKFKKLPFELCNKIFQYIDFKFQNNFYKDEMIMKTLSPRLNNEIMLYLTRNLFNQVEFFSLLSEATSNKLLSYLKLEVFLPNDVIIQAGMVGNSMYFINIGTVTVFSTTGKELCHLNDGAHFGEVGLLLNDWRMATVIAVTPTEVYKLHRKDFLHVMSSCPDLLTEIIDKAKEKISKFNK